MTFKTSLWRFYLFFASCCLFGFAIITNPAAEPIVAKFSGVLVTASASAIAVCGGSVQVGGEEGTVLRHPTRGLGIEMKNGCNGINVTILLWSAMLAFPATWMQKAKGLLIGTAAIQSINLIRFISLYYLFQYSQPLFDFAHKYLWESLIMLDALVIFWWWVQQVFRSRVAQSVPI